MDCVFAMKNMKGVCVMKNMKKYLSLLLALILFLACTPLSALAEGGLGPDEDELLEETLDETEEEAAEEEIEYPEELIVGHPTVTKGDFFTEMFGNDTADIDVRALIHGYNLVNWDQNQGVYVIDPSVVTGTLVVEDADGNRTYMLGLADDLFYSDGTPITAWDYAFSMLLMMAPEIEEIGGKIYRAEHILGYDEYITKEAYCLGGVNVISDHQLAITLDHEFLPYFFEIGLLLCVPYPIKEIAPGCKVYDDGYGVYIGNEDLTIEEPIFNAELLKETILNPETGYNSHPSVVSGPYVLTEYDGITAHFEINPYFKGAWVNNTLPEDFHFDMENLAGVGSGAQSHNRGNVNYIRVDRLNEDGEEDPFYLVKPSIEKICFTVADNDTMAEDLTTGVLHLVNKVVYGPTILECMGLGSMIGGDEDEEAEAPAEDEETEDALEPEPTEEPEETQDEAEAPEPTEAPEEPAEPAEGRDVKEEEEKPNANYEIRYQNYPRIGLAFLTFTYDWPTVKEMEVRQAIAWCMDRDQLTQDYCQGFGQRVDGYYGIEQWEYLLVSGQLDYPVNLLEKPLDDPEDYVRFPFRYANTDAEYEAAIAAWENLSLDLVEYTVDLDRANELLDKAKWTLNRDGETYRPGVDDVRCKMVDDELVALDLTMMYPAGNHIVDTIQENFIDNLNKCGILLTLVPTDMQDLFYSYYREADRTTDMIYLATNFHVIVDPSITYSCDPTADHLIWNNTYSDDEELFQDAVDMRKTVPGDVYTYVSKWITFQKRYNEVLPCIPIYSNIYFDFWNPYLQNYHITAHVTWTQAILEAYWGLDPEEEAPSEGDEALEGEEDEDDWDDDDFWADQEVLNP